tara:strand:- start:25 stop:1023 length:999 start_codon:yes stop_codon:yes gene_type:complete
MFKNKTLLITGGTGSFGNAVLDRFHTSDLKEIRVFSRDEKKQDDLRKKFKSKKIKFYIGDVRDYQSITEATKDVDYVFHAAALKQVPSCEFYPLEAVKTNVLGTENILQACILNSVKKVVCLSTDKAVYPINAMGASKALMEKVMVAKSRTVPSGTIFCATRYGNVIGSRGSVIPLFLDQIDSGKPLTITDGEMTRFMMSIDDAVQLVLHAFENGNNGDIFIQKSPAATINILRDAILSLKGKKNYEVQDIGTRHGEKLYEVLCSREEMLIAKEEDNFFRIPADNRDLNYKKFFDEGTSSLNQVDEYSSHNTNRLDLEQMKEILKKEIFKNT